MGREAKITEEDVFREADALLANGRLPEARLIRDKWGAGSMATVQRHLQKWRAQNLSSVDNTSIDPEVALAINQMFAMRTGKFASETQNKINGLNNDIALLIDENERQSAEIELLKNEATALQERLHEQAGKIQLLIGSEAKFQERAKEEIRTRITAQMALAKVEAKLESFHQLQEELKNALCAAKKPVKKQPNCEGDMRCSLNQKFNDDRLDIQCARTHFVNTGQANFQVKRGLK